jgi:hypothetical protein
MTVIGVLVLMLSQYMTYATTINRELCARAKRYWTAQEIVHYVVSIMLLEEELEAYANIH